jgi:hypothetical protein
MRVYRLGVTLALGFVVAACGPKKVAEEPAGSASGAIRAGGVGTGPCEHRNKATGSNGNKCQYAYWCVDTGGAGDQRWACEVVGRLKHAKNDLTISASGTGTVTVTVNDNEISPSDWQFPIVWSQRYASEPTFKVTDGCGNPAYILNQQTPDFQADCATAKTLCP